MALPRRLKARFGEHDGFVDVIDPSRLVDENAKPIEERLSWQLVEIDDDLAEAIAWLEEDSPDAAWQVRFAFEQHWGATRSRASGPCCRMAAYDVV